MFKKILIGAIILVALSALGYAVYKSYQRDGITLGYRENTAESAVITNVTTTATGNTISVVYYNNLGITMATEAASGTLKFACSLQDASPTFSATATASNAYDYVEIVDTQDGSLIDGDTGIVLENTTTVRQFEGNWNNFRWCTAILSGTVSGTTTVRFKPSDNQ